MLPPAIKGLTILYLMKISAYSKIDFELISTIIQIMELKTAVLILILVNNWGLYKVCPEILLSPQPKEKFLAFFL